MRNFSSLASRAAPEFKNPIHKVQTPHKIVSKSSKLNFRENLRHNLATGNPEFKDSNFDSVSTPRARIIGCENNLSSKPIDNRYLGDILSRKDWYLLLNHELKALRISLSTRVVVSILRNQENPLCCLRFYVWVLNIRDSFGKDQSIRVALSDVLYREGPILLSTELIQDIRNSKCRVTEDFLCALISSWGRLGLAKYCAEVFEQISYLGLIPSTRLYNAVIDALVKSNSLDLAYLKFQQMEVDNCVPDRFTYNILIHGVCKAGVVDEALRLVKQMEGLRHTPNVFTYTILIDGYCNAKRVDDAFGVLERMKVMKVRPNDATYRSLVNGAFRILSPHEAFELLWRWVKNERKLPKVVYDSILYCLSHNSLARNTAVFLRTAAGHGYIPDTLTFNILITCLIKGLEIEETCQIFDYYIKKGVNVDPGTCLALVGALYQSGRQNKGNQYLSWMLEKGLVSNVFAFNMVVDCFCKAKMMDNAFETLKEMSKKGIHPNLVTFNTLIAGFCKVRDVVKAQKMLLMLLNHGFKPDVFTFSSIIDGLCKANHITDAFDCFTEMVQWGISPNAITYNSLIRSLCLSGEVVKAMKLLRKMQVDGVQPDVYSFNALIQKYCEMNKIDKAQRLFITMLTLDLQPDNFTYISFIKALCESGRFYEAKELFSSMEANGCSPDVCTCESFVDALVKSRRFKEAQEVWLKCTEKGITLKVIPV
ncbi:pentatricopeptide repeat-containing protein mitochondrial [Dorcoceras hygrometricum]|uniref:Pentatricopeptide repeat-containing protein mitochondrial n=1 Tax=Dorcoceras hygrometricum TaxID=472368 RepID=A0A2Z7A600_9LAMI|nr:pentatricopeptide repeat-containing protein mitochondrial [Dorcoceras hygrometricum]